MEEDELVNKTESSSEAYESSERMLKRSRLLRPQAVQSKKFCAKDERNASIKKVSVILQKSETDRTSEESQVLTECSEAVEEVQSRRRRRDEAKRRLEEVEDTPEVLQQKCMVLAQAIAQSQHLVVYTGAGISTAAKIPDYRGPNGIWTRLQQGKEIGDHDLSLAEPTFTHMALFELYKKNILKYIVSQNCDGLHLRSGLPRTFLSELHGNMYVEVCKTCKPVKEYWRLFDVTENTARYSHKTFRKCYVCNEPLIDTIVHFGERGKLQWPLNWSGACKNAENATTILCLGSSLKVLKKYPWLWQMGKPAKKRPNLYIVNLQWTPKDEMANIKINGRCDQVMEVIMNLLDIKVGGYDKAKDPIFAHYTLLNETELHTTTQPILKCDVYDDKDCFKSDTDLSSTNKIKTEHCDTVSNSNKTPSSSNASTATVKVETNVTCLPVKKEATNCASFSIENILHRDDASLQIPQQITPNLINDAQYSFFNRGNLALLEYNTFASNLMQYQQILGAYPELIYYPYQTSFLYPGLHSIINTIPNLPIAGGFIKNESVSNSAEIKEVVVKREPSCHFCDKNYNSVVCLFYPKGEATFSNLKYRFSKLEQKDKPNYCVCCDYSTDEEDLDCSDSTKELNDSSKDLTTKNSRIQAGWFGKGCKKNRRLKKK